MRPVGVAELKAFYTGVTARSLRLETRQTYAVPWEVEGLEAWRQGEPEPPSEQMEQHLAGAKAIAESGRREIRVRFLELPMTEYTRHEFEVAYPGNTAAGEEIYVLDRALHPEFDRDRDDYVVFDDRAVLWYRYTPDDVLTGYEYSEESEMVQHHLARAEAALAVAVPFVDFVARQS